MGGEAEIDELTWIHLSSSGHHRGCTISTKHSRCRANSAHVRQPGPDFFPGFQAKVRTTFQAVSFTLGSGIPKANDRDSVHLESGFSKFFERTFGTWNSYFFFDFFCKSASKSVDRVLSLSAWPRQALYFRNMIESALYHRACTAEYKGKYATLGITPRLAIT